MSDIVTITFPDIGEGVVEGEVIEWLKQEGDALKKDEPVVVVMTDKATVELPSPYSGILKKQYHLPGQMAQKDYPLYDIEVEGKVDKPSKAKKTIKKSREKVLATPATRQLAKELGIDIESVTGTGKEGRVTDEDVVKFHAGGSLFDDQKQPIIGVQHQMAEKMVESKSTVPHFSYFDQLNASRLIQIRKNIQPKAENEGYKLTYMPFFIKALSLTLKKYPTVNASVTKTLDTLWMHQHHNIGVATKTENGLMIFVLKDVQDKSLEQVIKEYNQLAVKMKEGKLDREDMIDSTMTISNFGPLGGLWATPIINYPEVAILGVAKIRKEPIVKNDEVVIQPRLNLSWSFDHRVIDGGLAAEFSNHFISLIENPVQLT